MWLHFLRANFECHILDPFFGTSFWNQILVYFWSQLGVREHTSTPHLALVILAASHESEFHFIDMFLVRLLTMSQGPSDILAASFVAVCNVACGRWRIRTNSAPQGDRGASHL